MTEKERIERAARLKKAKEKRQRQVRRMQLLLGAGVLAVCVGVGVLVSSAVRRSSAAEGEETRSAADAVATGADLRAGDVAVGTQTDQQALDVAQLPMARETAAVKRPRELPEIRAIYAIGVHGRGWSHFFADNSYGMAPAGEYVTSFRATLQNQTPDLSGTIEYRVNLSGSGWLDWQADAAEAGEEGGEMPLEAVAMRLTGDLAEYYDVLYSVLQDGKWTDWVSNGAEAGQTGASKRVDGVRMSVVKRREGEPSYAGGIDPKKPMVALTFDDGPSKSVTPRILQKLKECGGRATFFMVGTQAEKNQEVIHQMAAQGCEVANHTYDHTLMTKVAPEVLAEQLAKTNMVVSAACGISPMLMRPCGGAKTDIGMSVVGAVSMPAILWSIDTLDWKTRDAAQTVSAVLDHVKDGDIVLMHDLYEATADASEIIIEELTKRGYQLVTVSELASYRGGMLPGKSYGKFPPQS